MFCNNCGKQVDDSTAFCPYCGKKIGGDTQQPAANAAQQPVQPPVQQAPVSQAPDSNPCAIIGFIFSFFGGLIGLICSIIGLINANKGAPHKGLAIAGIVISCSWVVILFILIVTGGGILAALAGSLASVAPLL